MAKLTYPDKTSGQTLSSQEANEIKVSVNDLYDTVYSVNPLTGLPDEDNINPDILPEIDFPDTNNQETTGDFVVTQTITGLRVNISVDRINDLINDRIAAMGLFPRLAAPALTLTVLNNTEIKVDWTKDNDADTSTLEISTAENFGNSQPIYTEDLNTYIKTGLTASTLYYFRVKSQANGFIDSVWVIASAKTNAVGSANLFTTQDFWNNAYWSYINMSFGEMATGVSGGGTAYKIKPHVSNTEHGLRRDPNIGNSPSHKVSISAKASGLQWAYIKI
jgi:hypothetical protein